MPDTRQRKQNGCSSPFPSLPPPFASLCSLSTWPTQQEASHGSPKVPAVWGGPCLGNLSLLLPLAPLSHYLALLLVLRGQKEGDLCSDKRAMLKVLAHGRDSSPGGNAACQGTPALGENPFEARRQKPWLVRSSPAAWRRCFLVPLASLEGICQKQSGVNIAAQFSLLDPSGGGKRPLCNLSSSALRGTRAG